MRRRILSVAALILAAACGVADNSITEPTIQRPLVASPALAFSCPATFADLQNQLNALFANGSNDETSALSKLNNIQHQLDIDNLVDARAKAWDLAGFIQQKKTKNTFLGDTQEITAFIRGLFCFVGYGPNSFLIFPSDLAQTLETIDGFAGVQVPANNVTVPTLLTINPLDAPPVFDTKLDVYPLYYAFDITNESGAEGSWVNPVVVGVCATADGSVLPNLLLGHQSDTGFELLDPEPVPFLDCSGAGGSANIVVNADGDSLVVAAAVIGSAGVGGSTDDFSPIAPVDGRVVGSSGAGGSADDFRPRRGMTPSMKLVSLQSIGGCQAVIGTEVDPSCRPLVTFATPKGTELTIPVDWAVETGGGSIANPPGCSPFQSILTQNTDAVTGVTTVCWKLGMTVGTNTVTAKGQEGGDAPSGVNFVYDDGDGFEDVAGIRFSAEAIKLSSTITITCTGPITYSGSAQTPCTATVSDANGQISGALVTLTYQNNTNAGTATVDASYAGDATHYGNTATSTFTINKATATAAAGNATMQFGGVVPAISCTVAGLALPYDAGAITCTAAAQGTPLVPGVATVATVTYNTALAQNNYAVTLVNGFLTVQGYVQVGCFASPVFSVMPSTKSAQNKGSNLPVKCTLKQPNGSAVANATGSLQLWDLGTGAVDGSTPQPSGPPGLTIPGAFAPTSNGNYSHQLNTNPTFYVAGRAYYIKATWSDGSTTVGYFRIK